MKISPIRLVTKLLAFQILSSAFAHEDHENLRHWEIPSSDPDRIILTFNGDPATSRAVTWRTDESVKQGVAQISEAIVNSDIKKHAVSQKAITTPFELGQFGGNASLTVHYHSVTFENLKPGTLYAYRVGGGNNWSEWIQFRTAKSEYAPTEFVYFGDAQNDVLSHWSRVIRMAYQTAPNASFAIHAGDLINRAHRDLEWAEWYKAGGFIHSQWTAIPVAGNHEYGGGIGEDNSTGLAIQWRPQFTLPLEEDLPEALHETVYTIDYQDVRVIALNSNRLQSEQTDYLEKQLANCTAKWKIVTCHHSIFSPRRSFTTALTKWKPLLDKYNVDLVLNGHDHTYARGHVPVRTADGNESESLGAIYVTSVSGPKQYKLDSEQLNTYKKHGYQLVKRGEQTQFFQVIKIDGQKLTYIAYNTLGEEYDRAVILKDFNTGKKKLQPQPYKK